MAGLALDTTSLLGSATVRRYKLDNGLKLIALIDRGAPIVAYQTWFGVGSSNEVPGATGLAHLFEHLMFSRTEATQAGEFDRLVEGIGGDSNAATWVDWTYYRLTLPAAQLPLAVRLESERMSRLVLDAETVETERSVVMNERRERVEDDVDGWMDETMMAQLFTRHPYHWPTIGWMRDIKDVPLGTIREFYRTWYVPNNATIVVAGDFDIDHLGNLLETAYGHLPARPLPPLVDAAEAPLAGHGQHVAHKPVTNARVLLGYRACPQRHADWAALEIMSTLLAGGPSSLLYRDLVITRELASSVDTQMLPFRHPGAFRISATCMEQTTPQALCEAIEAKLASLAAGDLVAADVERAKNLTETAFWNSLADLDGKAEALGHFETSMGDFRELMGMSERLAAVTPADLIRVASTYLRHDNAVSVLALPSGDEPDEEADEAVTTTQEPLP
ncbi:MAG: insulinase family protein [Myxococcales bacterium]|nr:insulinase family protein [Myxococcales bacterium]